MVRRRRVTVASRALAALVFAPFVVSAFTGVLPSTAVDTLSHLVPGAPLVPSEGLFYFVLLPWLLGIALVVRAYATRDTGDAVLAVFSIPVMVASPWAIYRHVFTAPPDGVVLVPVWSSIAGLLLAGFVLLDAAMDVAASRRRSVSRTGV